MRDKVSLCGVFIFGFRKDGIRLIYEDEESVVCLFGKVKVVICEPDGDIVEASD